MRTLLNVLVCLLAIANSCRAYRNGHGDYQLSAYGDNVVTSYGAPTAYAYEGDGDEVYYAASDHSEAKALYADNGYRYGNGISKEDRGETDGRYYTENPAPYHRSTEPLQGNQEDNWTKGVITLNVVDKGESTYDYKTEKEIYQQGLNSLDYHNGRSSSENGNSEREYLAGDGKITYGDYHNRRESYGLGNSEREYVSGDFKRTYSDRGGEPTTSSENVRIISSPHEYERGVSYGYNTPANSVNDFRGGVPPSSDSYSRDPLPPKDIQKSAPCQRAFYISPRPEKEHSVTYDVDTPVNSKDTTDSGVKVLLTPKSDGDSREAATQKQRLEFQESNGGISYSPTTYLIPAYGSNQQQELGFSPRSHEEASYSHLTEQNREGISNNNPTSLIPAGGIYYSPVPSQNHASYGYKASQWANHATSGLTYPILLSPNSLSAIPHHYPGPRTSAILTPAALPILSQNNGPINVRPIPVAILPHHGPAYYASNYAPVVLPETNNIALDSNNQYLYNPEPAASFQLHSVVDYGRDRNTAPYPNQVANNDGQKQRIFSYSEDDLKRHGYAIGSNGHYDSKTNPSSSGGLEPPSSQAEKTSHSPPSYGSATTHNGRYGLSSIKTDKNSDAASDNYSKEKASSNDKKPFEASYGPGSNNSGSQVSPNNEEGHAPNSAVKYDSENTPTAHTPTSYSKSSDSVAFSSPYSLSNNKPTEVVPYSSPQFIPPNFPIRNLQYPSSSVSYTTNYPNSQQSPASEDDYKTSPYVIIPGGLYEAISSDENPQSLSAFQTSQNKEYLKFKAASNPQLEVQSSAIHQHSSDHRTADRFQFADRSVAKAVTRQTPLYY